MTHVLAMSCIIDGRFTHHDHQHSKHSCDYFSVTMCDCRKIINSSGGCYMDMHHPCKTRNNAGCTIYAKQSRLQLLYKLATTLVAPSMTYATLEPFQSCSNSRALVVLQRVTSSLAPCAVDRALVHRGRGRASYIAMAKPSKTQLVTDYIQLEIGRPRMASRMWPCTICTVLARCEWCGCMDGGRRTVDKTVGMTVDAWTVEDGLWTRLWARLWMVDG